MGIQEEPTTLESEVLGLGMFVGEYTHNLDPKRRLTIPSVWRSLIGRPKSIYIMPDFNERCLRALPAREMALKLDRLRQKSMGDRAANEAQRRLGAVSDVLIWDTQGRIRISNKLLTWAGLEEQCVLVGALGSFEIWSPEHRSVTDDIDQQDLQALMRHIDL